MEIAHEESRVERRERVARVERSAVDRERLRALAAIRPVRRERELARSARRHERPDELAALDQRDALRTHESFTLERRRDAVGGRLGDRHAGIEARAIVHPREAALLGRQRARREAAPAEQRRDFLHGRRSQIGAVFPGTERPGRHRDMGELAARLVHFRDERALVPREARQRRLHRLVFAVVQAPLQVEGRRLVPIALAERVGEAAMDRSAGVDADEIEAGCGTEHRIDDRFGRRQGSAARGARRYDIGRDQQVRVLVHVRDDRAQRRDDRVQRLAVFGDIAGERYPMRRMSLAADQLDLEIALDDRARLPDLSAIHPDEVGGFGGEPRRVRLAGNERSVEDRGEIVKIRFHQRRRRRDVPGRVHRSASEPDAPPRRRTPRHPKRRTPATRVRRESPAKARPCRNAATRAPGPCFRCRRASGCARSSR